ncbi:MAG: Flp family type IVb pilin [Xanthobacteraceae bacterium]|jgi:pilus assembly protein Flp/PilA
MSTCIRKRVYEFTVNADVDLFTIMLLIANCTSVDIRGAIDMLNKFRRFLKDESGATAVEYALITSGISVAIIPSVSGVGNKLVTIFSTIQTAL